MKAGQFDQTFPQLKHALITHYEVGDGIPKDVFAKEYVSPLAIKLRKYGEAARYMTSPAGNFGKPPPMPVYAVQLEETIKEWRRRHPKEASR